MVVDTSALIAILFEEPGWEPLENAIFADDVRYVSTVSRLEATMVAEGRKAVMRVDLEDLIGALHLETIAFDQNQFERAVEAFRRCGKGRHPAALNLGDCCSYALAKTLDQPLLFKGDDFSQTDVRQATKG